MWRVGEIMKKYVVWVALAILAMTMLVVGAMGMRAETSSSITRIESRPTFIYTCASCHN